MFIRTIFIMKFDFVCFENLDQLRRIEFVEYISNKDEISSFDYTKQ
jgi:hypothetical protein